MDIFMWSLLRICYFKACREEEYPSSLPTLVCSLVFVQGALNDLRKDASLRHQVRHRSNWKFVSKHFSPILRLFLTYCGCQFDMLCPARHLMEIRIIVIIVPSLSCWALVWSKLALNETFGKAFPASGEGKRSYFWPDRATCAESVSHR